MKFLVLLLVLMASQPSYACHRFSVWKYSYPQRCRVATVPVASRSLNQNPHQPPTVDHSWYVEIAPPPEERTPEQIREEVEHDQAVAKHKDDLNDQLRLLEELKK